MSTIQIPLSEQDAQWYSELGSEGQKAVRERLERALRAERMRQLLDQLHMQMVDRGLTPEIAEDIERRIRTED